MTVPDAGVRGAQRNDEQAAILLDAQTRLDEQRKMTARAESEAEQLTHALRFAQVHRQRAESELAAARRTLDEIERKVEQAVIDAAAIAGERGHTDFADGYHAGAMFVRARVIHAVAVASRPAPTEGNRQP